MRAKRLGLLALISLVASPASAQIAGRPLELSARGGWYWPDARAHVESGLAFGGSLGWRLHPRLVLEGYALFAPSDADTAPAQKHNFSTGGLDFRFNLKDAHERVVPFLFAGMGYGLSHTGGHPPEELERGAPSAGIGLLLNMADPRAYLRLQVRDVLFRERESKQYGHNPAVTAGLHWLIGGKPRDTDLDGVREWLDRCPQTPIGATVDATGCPKDSDGDGVLDGIDQCADTPKGATVDAKGCPSDSDGDGSPDGIDQCADTPKGATVDARGCPADADGDKVFDGLDQCEGTPSGCQVDERGCPKDADSDGVCDGVDTCPDTGPGLKVDEKGCPIEVIDKETELLDTGRIRLEDVNFETGKAEILPQSFGVLDAVGQVLLKWPELKIEIGGHTDARGSDRLNQRLSEARSEAVRTYLAQKFPELKVGQFTVRGYGESRPVVPNTSPENMGRNRRVEFVVMNKDVLRKEIERRRLLRQGEETPVPTPEPAVPDTSGGN